MPDRVLPSHPVMRQLYQMKPRGWEERQVLGGALSSVCLLHGQHRAFVDFQEVTVAVGGRVWPGVLVPTVTVVCDPACGYLVRWCRDDDLSGCRCSLDT
ncbi:hypothetical protein SEA_MILANI_51 [Microbacterium phage Milani]|nr:hypothetical protein SEA_MILANI_51 [Microbacterium phage Milani]